MEKINTENEAGLAKGMGEVVFVVEDDGEARRLAVQQLKSLGYETIEAANGQQAIDMMESGVKFDLLFSDVIMPGLSGFDVTREVRARYPDMPVLLTSGFSGAAVDEILRIMPSVRIELISKPYRKPALASKIREMLDKRADRN